MSSASSTPEPCYLCDIAEASGAADPVLSYTCDRCRGVSHAHWSQIADLDAAALVILRCHYCKRELPPFSVVQLVAISGGKKGPRSGE